MNELDLWDPFRHMQKLQRRLFDFGFPLSDFEFRETGLRSPLIDMRDLGNTIELVAELPGVKKEDISLDVSNDHVTIKAKTESKKEKESKNYYYHERSFSEFSRTIPIPSEVIPEKTTAEFKNGILKLNIPKKNPSKGKGSFKVKIK